MKKDPSLDLLNAAAELGYEARGATGDHAALKLWLRMLSCTNQIEAEIRRRLRVRFDTSLPRFDYLAQLYREPDGLRMKELSSHLMVTGANVTGVTDELERDGLVARSSSPSDRRSWIVRLTPKGRQRWPWSMSSGFWSCSLVSTRLQWPKCTSNWEACACMCWKSSPARFPE